MSTKELNESLYQAISGSVDTAKAVDFLDVAVKAAKGKQNCPAIRKLVV